MKPNIAIIILNWKQPELTLQTINSITSINHSIFNYHLYVIDNGSEDNSVRIFKQYLSKSKLFTLINLSSNTGYAQGNNVGIQAALSHNHSYILIINNDVRVDKNFLSALYKFIKSYPNTALVCPKIYFEKGYEYQRESYDKKDLGRVIWSVGGIIDWKNIYGSNKGIDEIDIGQYQQPNFNLDFVSGCCFLANSKIFKKIGMFDPDYFMYLEDADLCQRVITQGYQIGYCPTSKIWHLNASSSSVGGNLHDYFLTRNRLLFGFRYAPIRTKISLFKDSLRILFKSPSRWQKKAVIDYYFHNLGKGSWK